MLRPRRDAATPRPNTEQVPPRASCRAGAAPSPPLPRHPIGFFFPSFFTLLFLFRFFFPPPPLQPSPALCPAPRWGPSPPFPSPIPLLPSLLFAAGGRPASLHPGPSQCSQQAPGTGEGQALLEGTVPHPSGQSCPQFGGPLVTARGVPSLFAAPRTDPHLWNGALGNADSSSGSLGRLFAPRRGVLQVFRDVPPWAGIPAGADAARSPSGRANKALSSRVPASSPLFVELSRPSLYGGGGRTPLKGPHSAPGGG